MEKNFKWLRYSMEEVLEYTTKKHEELKMKVQDQCMMSQQLLAIVWLAPAQGSITFQEGIKEEVWTMVPTQMKREHRVIQIPIDTIELSNPRVQEKLQGLSHMDLVMSQIPMELL
jgi:hypothetical protein